MNGWEANPVGNWQSESGPCVGCYQPTKTAVSFHGPEAWLLAALMVVTDTDEKEARGMLDTFWQLQAEKAPLVGSVDHRMFKPSPEFPIWWLWMTIGVCEQCASRGHFQVTEGREIPCYLPPEDEGKYS